MCRECYQWERCLERNQYGRCSEYRSIADIAAEVQSIMSAASTLRAAESTEDTGDVKRVRDASDGLLQTDS